jgi:hypothetical protein
MTLLCLAGSRSIDQTETIFEQMDRSVKVDMLTKISSLMQLSLDVLFVAL